MKKYLAVLKISLAQEFVYRLNFVVWRVRNVLQFILIYFLWSSVFSDPARQVFGYDRTKILTYIFGILVLRALVFSARVVDMAGEISEGKITNYLLKPVNYFRYWASRDAASKLLNLGFATAELIALYLVFKPEIFLQENPFILAAFFLAVTFALILFFCILFLVNMIAFWLPENGWAAQFLFIVIITEFASGGVFPLDIFPSLIQKILYSFPFPYLLFFPLQVYLGKATGLALIKCLVAAGIWTLVLLVIIKAVWRRGVKNYAGIS